MEKSDLSPDVSIKSPQIHETAYIAEGAQVIGDVILKADSSIWYNTVCRADINQIVIGERTNIQDNSVIHLENDQGVLVENDVTVGHNAIIHGCSIADGALIGMGAIIMNGAVIGKGAVIGAGAVVKEDMVIPDLSLVVGVPGKIVKTLSPETYDENVKWAAKYVKLANVHRNK
ncbi:MAG: gamma carbonic anhydrase family protein [Candidatus Neomarinimicrobiota bacterium]|jgi:carbonic anhydrase/acetyltransferase-like protein (isoleucine patch superfamily)|nr:MAG: gamma carbonic anhydrase family protein [Candidatus Neomarinimicrobiota bacterium]|tara:strand:+ start:5246 stop:5767 length:522 start_codon:yes stop_codon:yes gene_type:complete